MNSESIIEKKENKKELTNEELSYVFNGYLNNKVNDEVMTRLLKAICKNGLNENEINLLTDIFIKSGDVLNLDDLGICVDKHSTGGVGDKTTLIIAPIIASCGVKIAKMSGRALGYTGGTIDKLESIKGFNVNLDEEDFFNQVKEINIALMSQTKNICPMDKKVYALRDITNTVESLGLIAVSIMSKKIASGAKIILIDIKVGKGALIKNKKDAKKLAKIMINIGNKYNRIVRCLITEMDNPLGDNIGNSLEVLEAIDILKNKKHNNLYDLCIDISAHLISMAKNISFALAKAGAVNSIKNNNAYNKFLDLVKYQKGDLSTVTLGKGKIVLATKKGYVKNIDSLSLGTASMALGAGRLSLNDKIDYKAGIVINKNIGSFVNVGDSLCTIYGDKKIDEKVLIDAFKLSKLKTKNKDKIIDII